MNCHVLNLFANSINVYMDKLNFAAKEIQFMVSTQENDNRAFRKRKDLLTRYGTAQQIV